MCKPSDKFCDVAVIKPPALPRGLKERIVAYASNVNNGTRVEVPMKKAGRTISTTEIIRDLPELVDHYNAVAAYIGNKFDEPIQTLIGISKLALMVLIYENKGDEISWHYDINVLHGKQFTVVQPLSGLDSCTQFEYIDEKDRVVQQRVQDGEAVMLQGDVLFHRATKQCAGQSRIAIVMEFSTNPTRNDLKRATDLVKQQFF